MNTALLSCNVNQKLTAPSAVNPARPVPTVEFDGDWLARARRAWYGLNPTGDLWVRVAG